MTADNIEHVISYWVIFQAFHSPSLAGFAVISHWVPFLLFSVYAGALADRYDCRRLIQISQGLFMLASFAWGVLFLSGLLRMWHAVVILLLHGAAGVISTPAVQLIVHDMVGGDQLPSAIRLNATSRYFAILLGPAVGGGLMLLLGPAWGLLTNVLIYLPLTILLIRLPYTGRSRHVSERRGAAGFGLGEALRLFAEVRADRRIVTMIVLGGATAFFVRQRVPGADAGVRASPRDRRRGHWLQRAPRRQRRGRGHRCPAARRLEHSAPEHADGDPLRGGVGGDDRSVPGRAEIQPGRGATGAGRRLQHRIHVDGPDARSAPGSARATRSDRRSLQHGDPRTPGRQWLDGRRAGRGDRRAVVPRAERGGRARDRDRAARLRGTSLRGRHAIHQHVRTATAAPATRPHSVAGANGRGRTRETNRPIDR